MVMVVYPSLSLYEMTLGKQKVFSRDLSTHWPMKIVAVNLDG